MGIQRFGNMSGSMWFEQFQWNGFFNKIRVSYDVLSLFMESMCWIFYRKAHYSDEKGCRVKYHCFCQCHMSLLTVFLLGIKWDFIYTICIFIVPYVSLSMPYVSLSYYETLSIPMYLCHYHETISISYVSLSLPWVFINAMYLC